MSTAYSSAKQQYIGNGVTTEWGFDFPIKKHSELKVYLKRSGLTQVLLEEGVDYSFVTENTIAFPIKTGEAKLQATDVLALQRESVFESEYNFSNQQRLEPEEVMHADDNLERQIQELKRDSEAAIKVLPTSNVDPKTLFEQIDRIYVSVDNIDTVANDKANVDAVAGSISNVNKTAGSIDSVNAVAPYISSVNTVSANISSVNTAASNIAAIQYAPTAATNASQSATNAANSATDSADSATSASASAQAAQDALNDVQGLIATPIGTIFQSIYVNESLDIARQLNGQLISSTKFTGFRSWLNTVQTATPSLFTTETNWQAEKTNSKLGQCGKFVIDDTAGTIRLPCVVNAQGLTDLALIGGIKSESLPNITGFEDMWGVGTGTDNPSGSYKKRATGKNADITRGGGQLQTYLHEFDASGSSSTYQNNAPVQQEAVQYPYYIQVATGIEETLPAIREYQINTPFFFGKSMYSDVAPDNASWLASNGQYNARSVYPDYYDWLLEQMNAGVSGFVASTAAYTDYDFVINTADQTFRLPLLNGEEDLPSDRYVDLTLTSTTQRFTAPANGIYTVSGVGFGCVDIHNETSAGFGSCLQPRTSDGFGRYTINAKQGDKIVILCQTIPSSYLCRFIYAQGNGTLYYYVGDTVQDASLINAGAVLGQLSTKTNSVEAAAASMPSSRYIKLTLGASGSTYTAPANGWLFLMKRAATSGQNIHFICNGREDIVWGSGAGDVDIILLFPICSGDVVKITYSAAGPTKAFRFIYANGEQ